MRTAILVATVFGVLVLAPGARATQIEITDTSQLTMFTVPAGVTSINFYVEGAVGRPGGGGAAGGSAGVVLGDLAVTPGQQLWVKVGARDQGGAGYNAFDAATGSVGGNGGGSSDIRTVENDLDSRVVVAGGGGGAGGSGDGSGIEGAGGAGGSAGSNGTAGTNASDMTGGGPGGGGGASSVGTGGTAGSLFGSPGIDGLLADGGNGGERGFSGGGAGGGGGGGGDGWFGGGGGGGGGSACCSARTAGGGGGGGGSNHTGTGVTGVTEFTGSNGDGQVFISWIDPPQFVATPASRDFGTVAPGSATAYQSFQVTNDNAGEDDPGDLSISDVSLTGADAGQFEIGADDCDGATLASGETCTVTARFNPTAAGAGNASLTFSHDGLATDPSPTAIPLSGVAVSSEFTFGKVRLKKSKGLAFLTVNLPGPGELSMSGKGVAGIAGAHAAQQVPGGAVELKVKPVGKAARKLAKKGKVAVNVTVTFQPPGGAAAQKSTGFVVKKTAGQLAGKKK